MTHFDHHVIIGTAKEVIAFGMLDVFNPKQLKIVVFDDGDITASSKRINDDFLRKLPSKCQQLYMSSSPRLRGIQGVTEMTFLADSCDIPKAIEHRFVKCSDKYAFVEALSAQVYGIDEDGKMIVFFNVSSKSLIFINYVIET